jgi:hypothetical protein
VYNAVLGFAEMESIVFSIRCDAGVGLLILCAQLLRRASAYSLSEIFVALDLRSTQNYWHGCC